MLKKGALEYFDSNIAIKLCNCVSVQSLYIFSRKITLLDVSLLCIFFE